jgi:dihydroorotate dehydrogenase electron transfer subunit
VLSNDPLCPEHYYLRLGLEHFPSTYPGQFINILCGTTVGWADRPTFISASEKGGPPAQPTDLSQAETVGRVPLLRRPFGLAGRRDMPDGTIELDSLYRVVGSGSNWISERKIGDEVNILGPLGNGFTIREDKPLAAVIGGGTGIGPMIYLSESLSSAGKDVTAFVGARTASALPLTEEQKGLFEITTDDGSLGQAGMVHQAFSRWLNNEKSRPDEIVVFACGPEPMMKAVADICTPSGIECQLAMERHMACGMGVCQGCAIKVKTDEPPGWMFKLVCKDGPVFDAVELVWE